MTGKKLTSYKVSCTMLADYFCKDTIVKAASKEAALKKAWEVAYAPGLCHQCADLEVGDMVQVLIENVDDYTDIAECGDMLDAQNELKEAEQAVRTRCCHSLLCTEPMKARLSSTA